MPRHYGRAKRFQNLVRTRGTIKHISIHEDGASIGVLEGKKKKKGEVSPMSHVDVSRDLAEQLKVGDKVTVTTSTKVDA